MVFPGAGRRNTVIGNISRVYKMSILRWKALSRGFLQYVKFSTVFLIKKETVTSFSLGTNHPFGQKRATP